MCASGRARARARAPAARLTVALPLQWRAPRAGTGSCRRSAATVCCLFPHASPAPSSHGVGAFPRASPRAPPVARLAPPRLALTSSRPPESSPPLPYTPPDALCLGPARQRHGARGPGLREGATCGLRRCCRRGKARVRRVPALGRRRGPGQALPCARGARQGARHRGRLVASSGRPRCGQQARSRRSRRAGLVAPRARAAARRGTRCVTTTTSGGSSCAPH